MGVTVEGPTRIEPGLPVEQRMKKSAFWLALVLIGVAASILMRAQMLNVPLERDEGGYAYIADRWLQGETPYRDTVDSKPPGIFAAYALILAVGRNVGSIRVFLLFWSVLTVVLFYLLARKHYGREAASLAAALLALTQAAPAYFGFSGNAEMFMVAFTVAAMLSAPKEERNVTRYFASGVLLGAAALFKPVAMTEMLPLAALFFYSMRSGRSRLFGASLFVAGFGAMLLACWCAFARLGTDSEMVYWAFTYNREYAARVPLATRGLNLLYEVLQRRMLLRDFPLWAFATAGVVLTMKRKGGDVARAFPVLWLISAFIGVSASGRYTPHYFQQLLPPLCLLAGIAGAAWTQRIADRGTGAVVRYGGIALILIPLLVYPSSVEWPLVRKGPEISRELFGLNPFMEGEEIGRYLSERTNPNETIFIIGSEPQFLFHAQRRSASKLIFFAPLMAPGEMAARLQEETAREVEERMPRYIVSVNLVSSLVSRRDAPRIIFERMKRLIDSDYRREAALVAVNETRTQLLTENLPPVGGGPIVLDIYRRND
jgi:hypothetical protein